MPAGTVATPLGRGTCYRCGREFARTYREIVCANCRVKPSTELSPREHQLVAAVAQGCLNKEIAYRLHLSEGTIKEYLHQIFRKVGVRNRTALAIWALQNPDRVEASRAH